MNLKNLSESELLLKTKVLVAEEKRLTLEILHHLREIEARRLYAKLGRSSLFEYCTKDLGYSSGAAYRRIEAMRLLNEVPKVEEKLKAGEIHLSTLASVRGFLKAETKKYSLQEKEELIEKVANKSTREVEKIFLSMSDKYQPMLLKDKQVQLTPEMTKITFVADQELLVLLDQVKAKMACPQDINPDYNTMFKKMAKLYLKSKSIAATEQNIDAMKQRQMKEMLREQQNEKASHDQQSTIASHDQQDVIESIKANSTPKSNPSCASAPEVIETTKASSTSKPNPSCTSAAEVVSAKLVGSAPEPVSETLVGSAAPLKLCATPHNLSCTLTSTPEELSPKKLSRHIPAQVQRAVSLRAQNQCEFVSPITNQRCTAMRALQFDHCKTPYAAGGSNTLENLQLVCQQHNQWRAIQFYGVKKMEQYGLRR